MDHAIITANLNPEAKGARLDLFVHGRKRLDVVLGKYLSMRKNKSGQSGI